MRWKDFDPLNGNLRAEGNGHMITSRVERSIGLCLQYISTGPPTLPQNLKQILRSHYVPVDGITDLAFGVVPGNRNRHSWKRPVGTLERITQFLNFLDATGARNLRLSENLLASLNETPGWLPGFNDIIPLTTPKFSHETSLLNSIPMPNAYSPGILRTPEGLRIFFKRFHRYSTEQGDSASSYVQRMQALAGKLEKISEWGSKREANWGRCLNDISQDDMERELLKRAPIHQALDELEGYLIEINADPTESTKGDINGSKNGFCYDTLLVEHTRKAKM